MIVASIVVEVVNDERLIGQSERPDNLTVTPVTGVRIGTDDAVQDESMEKHPPEVT